MKFIDEVLDAEAKIVVMTETQSERQDQVWEYLKPLLGDRNSRIRAIHWPKCGVEDREPVLEDDIRKDIQQVSRVRDPCFIFVSDEEERS